MLSHFSRVRLFATLWMVAHQAPLTMGFSRQEYWRGLPCPPPGDLPHPGMEAESLKSPPLTGEFLTASAAWEAPKYCTFLNNNLVSLDWLCCWDPSLVSNTLNLF